MQRLLKCRAKQPFVPLGLTFLLRELFEPISLQPFAQARFTWMQNPDRMLQNYGADPKGSLKSCELLRKDIRRVCATGTPMLLSGPSHPQMSKRAFKLGTAVLCPTIWSSLPCLEDGHVRRSSLTKAERLEHKKMRRRSAR